MHDAILSVRNLDMHFPTGGGFFKASTGVVRAVDNVSFDVYRGETTLGRCVMRILEPTAGKIAFKGRERDAIDLTEIDNAAMRTIWRDIRMVFQDPQSSLNPRLPVIELVGQCLRKTEKLKGRELADRVAKLLLQVGLRPEFLHRYPTACSGGQRQRLGIARACDPSRAGDRR